VFHVLDDSILIPVFSNHFFPVLTQFFNVDSAESRYLIVGIKYYYRSGVSCLSQPG
jgi:hypothetical protein